MSSFLPFLFYLSHLWWLLIHYVMSNSLRPRELWHAKIPWLSLSPRVWSNSCPLNQLMLSHCLILCCLFLLLPSIFPSIKVFPKSQLFTSGGQSIAALVSASDLPIQFSSGWISFRIIQDWLVWSPCIPKDSQQSSPAPQFQSINSLALSLLYGSTLTSKHDFWNFD